MTLPVSARLVMRLPGHKFLTPLGFPHIMAKVDRSVTTVCSRRRGGWTVFPGAGRVRSAVRVLRIAGVAASAILLAACSGFPGGDPFKFRGGKPQQPPPGPPPAAAPGRRRG